MKNSPVKTTRRVLDFAIDALKEKIQEVLDDPTAHTEHMSAHWHFLLRVADDLGVDFADAIERLGSPFEIERLKQQRLYNQQVNVTLDHINAMLVQGAAPEIKHVGDRDGTP